MIKTLLKRGADHNNYCEDNLTWMEYNDMLFCAVFDGCSGAINSYFASELYSKIFRKAIKDCIKLYDRNINIISYDMIKNFIIYEMHDNLNKFMKSFDVNFIQLVSTMIFTIYDIKKKTGIICFIGDGIAVIDDKIIINDQNNEPNYLAHYLDVTEHELLNKLKENIYDIENLQRGFSISSDGLLSFKHKDTGITSDSINNQVIQNFCIDEQFSKTDIMLNRKYNILLNNGYNHYDDISIIRYII